MVAGLESQLAIGNHETLGDKRVENLCVLADNFLAGRANIFVVIGLEIDEIQSARKKAPVLILEFEVLRDFQQFGEGAILGEAAVAVVFVDRA